jgi:dimethylhistidine N-methyltransferase
MTFTDVAEAPPGAEKLFAFLNFEPPADDFRADALEGMSRRQKTLRPKYFYDERGSALFEDICDAPEYYIPEAELEILAARGEEIAKLAGPRAAIVELGAGAAVKIRTLLDPLEEPALYLAIDISREHVVAAAAALAADHSDLRIGAAHADFTHPLVLPDEIYRSTARRVVFFPGSTIGNFRRTAARGILETARGLLRVGDLMIIGVDLVKDPRVLEAAYNDAGGATAAFNLNLLTRINRELEGDIDVDQFAHRAHWNAEARRVEMHLVAREDMTFSVAGARFEMTAGETIYTEDSHKYDEAGFKTLAAEAGFARKAFWTDSRGRFSVQAFEAR